MSLAREIEPGAHIGKYRLARRLAVGGMGEVWVARNRATAADVAVKLCRGDMASEEAALRFRHEARLGAMLSHRSIVRTFDLVEESDGTLLLVMELLRGETLERYLEGHGPLPTKEAIAIALPVLSALAHAHACGVVHRDVTPSNIFLAIDPDGCVIPKLVDFGIAKAPASGFQTLDGRALGTPRYMAPEQIRAPTEIDGRSDLFGMSVVLYEMLTGSCPFAASTPAASLAAVLEAVVDPDPRIEPTVWIELQRGMSKRAYERHETANEMAEALRTASGETEETLATLLRGLPISRERDVPAALGPAPTRHVGRSHGYFASLSARRGALAMWLVAAVLAASVAAVATASFRQSKETNAIQTTLPIATMASPATASTPLLIPPQPPTPPSTSSAAETQLPLPSGSIRPARGRRVKPVATTPGF
jgi:eukaryotic-like serine/threonine-protein kinase